MKNYFNNTTQCLKSIGNLFSDFCQSLEERSLEFIGDLSRKNYPVFIMFLIYLLWCILHFPIVFLLMFRILFELTISIAKDLITVISNINMHLKKPAVATIRLTDWQVGDIIFDILFNNAEEIEILQPKMKESIFPANENFVQSFGSSYHYRFLIKPRKDSTLELPEMQKLINLKIEQYLISHYPLSTILFNGMYILQCYNVSKNGMTSGHYHIDILQIDSEDKYSFISSLNQQVKENELRTDDVDLLDKEF